MIFWATSKLNWMPCSSQPDSLKIVPISHRWWLQPEIHFPPDLRNDHFSFGLDPDRCRSMRERQLRADHVTSPHFRSTCGAHQTPARRAGSGPQAAARSPDRPPGWRLAEVSARIKGFSEVATIKCAAPALVRHPAVWPSRGLGSTSASARIAIVHSEPLRGPLLERDQTCGPPRIGHAGGMPPAAPARRTAGAPIKSGTAIWWGWVRRGAVCGLAVIKRGRRTVGSPYRGPALRGGGLGLR